MTHDDARRHFDRATALLHDGDAAGAAAAYAEASRLRPGWLAPVANRGMALERVGRYAEAELVLREALRLQPDCEPVLTVLTGVLCALGRPGEAVTLGARAVALAPEQPAAWINQGHALQASGEPVGAEAACRRALALDPGSGLAAYNLGHALAGQWRSAEALDCFRAAVERDPGYAPARHTLLMSLLYAPGETEESLYRAHRSWGDEVTARLPARLPPASPPAGDRPLRVGYLSPDFRAHSCAHFLQPLFAAHDRSAIEVFAYSAVARPDPVTAWFRASAAHWREVAGRPAADIAAQVRADRIDVLVDLGGHTRGHPLATFAWQPARAQVAWLGYPGTTGLAAIGHRVTDEVADPPGAADRWHTERLLRLPGGFLCYGPQADAPPVASPPVARTGCITFGSFNNLAKLTPEAVRSYAAILAAVPRSRLLLKAQALASDSARLRVAAAFGAAGISPDRLALQGWIPGGSQPLAAYGNVDIALDTFPYNGTTTTFEALWMGVPVVCLRGARHAARVGASILTALGRPGWIAGDEAGFVATAVALAADPAGLGACRRTLRDELAASGLCAATAFARRLEAAWREIAR